MGFQRNTDLLSQMNCVFLHLMLLGDHYFRGISYRSYQPRRMQGTRRVKSTPKKEPRFPQKPQFSVTASLIYSVQFPTHPPPNLRHPTLIYLQCIRGVARSCPSGGCSTYTVPVS